MMRASSAGAAAEAEAVKVATIATGAKSAKIFNFMTLLLDLNKLFLADRMLT
jgi:hypothetical protein